MQPNLPTGGQDVLVIVQQIAPGKAFPGTFHNSDPATLRVPGHLTTLPAGTQIVMLFQSGGYCTMNAEVTASSDHGAVTFFELKVGMPENLERRRSNRFPVQMDVDFAYVGGSEDDPQVIRNKVPISDISVTGMMVRANLESPIGCLFNVTIPLPNGPQVHALAVCTRAMETGMGLEFVDFVGNGSHSLRDFIESLGGQAAA